MADAVAFSPEGRVASAGEVVRLWDPVSLETKWETSLAPAAVAYWIAFSPDGRRIYAPSKEDTLTARIASTLPDAVGRAIFAVRAVRDSRDCDAIALAAEKFEAAADELRMLAARAAAPRHA